VSSPTARPQPDFNAIRTEFGLRASFDPDVLAEAERAAGAGVAHPGRVDATDLELVTVDPPGSKDLDQALAIEVRPGGHRVHYAIADLGAVVIPGGALDSEVRRRGQTVYLPDFSVPLHPPVLSEGAASLLPGQVRAAVLWTIDLDDAGEVSEVEVRRAVVRSRAQWDYQGAQAACDAGTLPPALAALPEVGRARRELAIARGAVELELPEQEVRPDGRGGWIPTIRQRLDVEAWNAEISLLTGMCAARIMLEARAGVIRTLPPPTAEGIAGLRQVAAHLGVAWPGPPDEPGTLAKALSGLDRGAPGSLALLRAATRLLRGAGYAAFDGTLPEQTGHGGIGAPYAHVTAPLRRLVDRFGAEVCLAATAGTELPDWLRAALPALPDTMSASDAVAGKVDRACVDAAEVTVLAGRVGESFDAIVLRAPEEESPGEVLVVEPPVIARCTGTLEAGSRTTVRLTEADPVSRRVGFTAP